MDFIRLLKFCWFWEINLFKIYCGKLDVYCYFKELEIKDILKLVFLSLGGKEMIYTGYSASNKESTTYGRIHGSPLSQSYLIILSMFYPYFQRGINFKSHTQW